MKRKLYDIGSGLACLMAGSLMLWLMMWLVYEANDLSSAVIVGAGMMAMVLREAYHQWRMEHARRRR